jgi:hypothetical protein
MRRNHAPKLLQSLLAAEDKGDRATCAGAGVNRATTDALKLSGVDMCRSGAGGCICICTSMPGHSVVFCILVLVIDYRVVDGVVVVIFLTHKELVIMSH